MKCIAVEPHGHVIQNILLGVKVLLAKTGLDSAADIGYGS
jgi:hypothetical protein